MPEGTTPQEPQKRPEIFLPNNVRLTIFYSSHGTRKDLGDFNEFQRKLKSSDIFIPEAVEWDQRNLDDCRKISNGNSGIFQEVKRLNERNDPHAGFNNAINDALFASYVKVLFVDLPAGTEEVERYKQSMEILPDRLFRGTFEDALEVEDDYIREFTEAIRNREDYILKTIGPKLSELIAQNPKLRNKPQVNVLMTIGALHKRLSEVLAEKAAVQRAETSTDLPQVRTEFGNITDDFTEKLVDSYVEGSNISAEERRGLLVKRLGKMFVDTMINQFQRTANSQTVLAWERSIDIVNALTEEEIRTIFEYNKAAFGKDTARVKLLTGPLRSITNKIGTLLA